MPRFRNLQLLLALALVWTGAAPPSKPSVPNAAFARKLEASLQKNLSDAEAGALLSEAEQQLILAPKHQSFWDTIAFLPYIRDPLYILKRELRWIPFFGWYIIKMRMIPVDRGKRAKALKQVIERTRAEMRENSRQLIIYPEGTRRAPGAEPAYKWGIVELYSELGLPVVPVAHQAGLWWPRRKFLRHPGTIRARFLPPIPPGLDKEAFHARLTAETETACDAYLIEAAKAPDAPPMPETARKRLAELGVKVKAAASA